MIQRVRVLLRRWDSFNEDEQRAAIIQMRTLMPSDKTLRIDADSILYYTAYAQKHKDADAIEGGTFIGDKERTNLVKLKQDFKDFVDNIVLTCELASFKGKFPRFTGYELVFTPRESFRYRLYPDYKKNRKNLVQSNDLKRLKKWAYKHNTVPIDVEADDYVHYHGLRGDPVASADKDVLNSVPVAYDYHPKHKLFITNTEKQRARWVLLQTLAGDPSDDIPGIKGVAMKTAEKLLQEGATFSDVVSIYEEKGYTKEDAILTRRLVGLDQYKRGKVRLFKHG